MHDFHDIRRKDRLLSPEGVQTLLDSGEYGVLSMCAANGYAYGVPISFARDKNHIYFHCAREGHKIENLRSNPKVSFCIVGNTHVIPEQFTTAYESVVVFGKIVMDLDDEERRKGLRLLVKKYCPEYIELGEIYMEKSFKRTHVLRLDIDHISGKSKKMIFPKPHTTT